MVLRFPKTVAKTEDKCSRGNYSARAREHRSPRVGEREGSRGRLSGGLFCDDVAAMNELHERLKSCSLASCFYLVTAVTIWQLYPPNMPTALVLLWAPSLRYALARWY